MRELDINKEINNICNFIAGYVRQSGMDNVVIGLSGGVDSSLSASLAVTALGKEHVYGVMLPWKESNSASYEDALSLAEKLGIHHQKIDITPMVEPYFSIYQTDADNLRLGNWMARIRMCVLYDLSAKYRALVLGTSNRTELLIGYFTQYGDGACALEPIGHLYKTEVSAMAKVLNIPQQIIDKTPTADLWADQTDEGEIGMSYKELDLILHAITETNLNIRSIINLGFSEENVLRVKSMMERTEFKRKNPPLINDWTLDK